MTIRTMIVDDEPPAREGIRLRLQGQPDIELVGEYGSAREAVAAIRENAPDLLFLDVHMPGISGIEMMHEIGPDVVPAVILVTAYEEHAVEAFEVSVVDYVLKPIDTARFWTAFDRARTHLQRVRALHLSRRIKHLIENEQAGGARPSTRPDEAAAPPPPYRTRYLVCGGTGEKLVSVDEIDWIEASGDYVKLHDGHDYHLVRTRLTQVESELDPRLFCRVHRGAMVRFDRVDEIVPIDHGDAEIRLKDGTVLRLSRGYRDHFRRALSMSSRPTDGG
jgi:two-component system LytT family response regulator